MMMKRSHALIPLPVVQVVPKHRTQLQEHILLPIFVQIILLSLIFVLAILKVDLSVTDHNYLPARSIVRVRSEDVEAHQLVLVLSVEDGKVIEDANGYVVAFALVRFEFFPW